MSLPEDSRHGDRAAAGRRRVATEGAVVVLDRSLPPWSLDALSRRSRGYGLRRPGSPPGRRRARARAHAACSALAEAAAPMGRALDGVRARSTWAREGRRSLRRTAGRHGLQPLGAEGVLETIEADPLLTEGDRASVRVPLAPVSTRGAGCARGARPAVLVWPPAAAGFAIRYPSPTPASSRVPQGTSPSSSAGGTGRQAPAPAAPPRLRAGLSRSWRRFHGRSERSAGVRDPRRGFRGPGRGAAWPGDRGPIEKHRSGRPHSSFSRMREATRFLAPWRSPVRRAPLLEAWQRAQDSRRRPSSMSRCGAEARALPDGPRSSGEDVRVLRARLVVRAARTTSRSTGSTNWFVWGGGSTCRALRGARGCRPCLPSCGSAPESA